MCGRTCLTLSPQEICECFNEKNKPEWRSEYNGGKNYVPSYNLAPTNITPVIISSSFFDDKKSNNDRILMPMMWSVIPYWHKGDYRKHGLSTNNCRLETILESKLYKRLLLKGQKCVIISEGFYEWQTSKKVKSSERAAYYIYMPQNDEITIHNKSTWKNNNINLMKIAGLFDVWIDENGDQIYNYTVITFESNEKMSWMHHRMPAILETDQQITEWLNNNSYQESLKVLQPAKTILWYQVNNKVVNNARNNSELCNKPYVEKKALQSQMKTWLIPIKKRNGDSDEENNKSNKKARLLME